MEIDPQAQTMEQNYKVMTGLVVPRPIAWITTISANGKVNLAPFSAFTFVCHDPPMIAVNIGHNATGLRDTGINIQRTGEFVVNIANQSLLNALHASSAVYAPDESEVEALSLATVKSATVAPPRVLAAPACLECILHQSMTLGRSGVSLFIGEVTRFFVRDDLMSDGKIATAALDPIARIGGPNYATLGKLLTLPEALPHQARDFHLTTGAEAN